MEEKKKIAAEQEQNIRLRSQPSVMQNITTSKPTTKDTPTNLFDSNLMAFASTSNSSSIAQPSKQSGNIDLSEFLPPSLSGSTSTPNFGAQNNLFSQQTTSSGFGLLPQPPQASNPVNRSTQQFNAFPAFPTSQPTGFGMFPQPPQPSFPLSNTNAKPTKPNTSAFDDLLSFPLNVSKKSPSPSPSMQKTNGSTKSNLDDLLS